MYQIPFENLRMLYIIDQTREEISNQVKKTQSRLKYPHETNQTIMEKHATYLNSNIILKKVNLMMKMINISSPVNKLICQRKHSFRISRSPEL